MWESTVYTLRKTQHIIPSIHATLCAYLLSVTLRLILYSVPLIRLPSFALHRAFPFRSPIPTALFFHRGPFSFFTRPPSPLYTRYAYILQLVVKHRAPASLPPPLHRMGDYHPLWARTLSRPLSRSWPVPDGYKPSRDNHRDTKCVSARKSCVRTPHWHLGITRFTVFM